MACNECSPSPIPVNTKNPTTITPTTFEDYFAHPTIQRVYFLNILSVQLSTSALCFLVSFVCTVISNQNKFLVEIDEILNSLALNSFLLLLFGCLFSILIIRFEKLNHYPWFLVKIVLETSIRMFQSALAVFWIAFICEKLRLKYNDNTSHPSYFCVCLVYGLNLCLYLNMVLWLRFKSNNATLDKSTIHMISLTRIAMLLLISLPVIWTSEEDSSNATWSLGQVFVGAVCGLLDGVVTAYAFLGAVKSTTTTTVEKPVEHI